MRIVTALVSAGILAMVAQPAVAKGGPVVTVASFNICKTDCAGAKVAWAQREKAIVRTIAALQADVVAVQEADKSVWSLAEKLREHGYALANTDDPGCYGTRTRCVSDSFLFYRTSTIEMTPVGEPNDPYPAACTPYLTTDQPPYTPPPAFTEPEPQEPSLDPWDPSYDDVWDAYWAAWEAWSEHRQAAEVAHWEYENQVAQWWERYAECYQYRSWKPLTDFSEGTLALSAVAGDGWPAGVDDRGWSYAFLRHRRTGGDFLAVAVHLPNEKTRAGERIRVAVASGLAEYLYADVKSRGLGKIPMVVAGDLNSYQRRQPRGAQYQLTRAGFLDAYTAAKRVNGDVPTVNVTTVHRDPFPARPNRAADPARIDYVFVQRGRPVRYEVFARMRHGRFDNRYRPSDHNPVKAVLRLSAFRAKSG